MPLLVHSRSMLCMKKKMDEMVDEYGDKAALEELLGWLKDIWARVECDGRHALPLSQDAGNDSYVGVTSGGCGSRFSRPT